MSGLRDEMSDCGFSLTGALRDVLAWGGCKVELDELHCALGLAFMVCGRTGEDKVSKWTGYARDAFLVRGAKVFGAEIRDVHPPEAARGLERASEFEQHFDASYRPLIQNALKNGQFVLAWQGWESDDGLAWGRVVGECEGGVGFEGRVYRGDGAGLRAVMVRPAIQLYVVERVRAVALDVDELLMMMASDLRAVLENAVGEQYGVVTGMAAYELWGDATRGAASEQVVREGQNLAAAMVRSNECGVRVLEKCRGVAHTRVGKVVDPMLRAAREVVERLGGWIQNVDRRSGDGVTLVRELSSHLAGLREESLRTLRDLNVAMSNEVPCGEIDGK